MNRVSKHKIGEKLLQEIDRTFQFHFHQTLDEVITELRIRSIIARSTRDPINLISDLWKSGVLHFSSDAPVVYLRKAIERFHRNEYGICTRCGSSIPEDWLMRNPLVEYCSYCMVESQHAAKERNEWVFGQRVG